MLYSAHIYELTNWKPRKKDILDKFNGKFFRKSISDETRSCSLGELNGVKVELIQFFSTNLDAIRTMVIVSQNAESALDESTARGVLGQFVGPTEKSPVSRVIWMQGDLHQCSDMASVFLRNSHSLTASSFKSQDNLRFVAEAKGLAVVDTTENALAPGERVIKLSQLVALAYAYLSVLDDVIEKLAHASQSNSKAAELELRKWSEFLSAHYFSEPVKLATIELSTFYGAVRNRHKITLHAEEVTEQLRLLAELVRLDRTDAQAQRDQTLQRSIAIFGIILTIIGLVQIMQILPEIVSKFRNEWLSCYDSGNLEKCLLGKSVIKSQPEKPIPFKNHKSQRQ